MVTIRLSRDRLARLRQGSVMVAAEPAIIEVTGAGALACLQGLLTNDLDRPGPDSAVYGALLTPKGMIVVDLWVLRRPDSLLLVAEPEGHAVALDLLRRQLPPRLARATDRTGVLRALWLYGLAVPAALAKAGLGPLPPPGGLRQLDGGLLIARPQATAPFVACLVAETAPLERARPALAGAGVLEGDRDDREAARILAGWPRLGVEIGEKTLPQEVRYDEIDGVSYDKGCYVGQETVARLHFRGHANRGLRGLDWQPPLDAPTGDEVTAVEGNAVGTVSSVLQVDGQCLGLAMLRREVADQQEVLAAGGPARVVPLPFQGEA
jgi:folate-binding protein YgfZ